MKKKPMTVYMCKGCGGKTRSLTGYCSLKDWCRSKNQQESASNQARRGETGGKRKYVRKSQFNTNPSEHALNPLAGISQQEYDRRMALVQEILDHKNCAKVSA